MKLSGLVLFPPPLAWMCGLGQAAFCGRTSCCAKGPHSSWVRGGGLALLLSLQVSVALWRALKCRCRAGWATGRAGLAAPLSPVSLARRPGRSLCRHPSGTPELSVRHGAVLSCGPGRLLSSLSPPGALSQGLPYVDFLGPEGGEAVLARLQTCVPWRRSPGTLSGLSAPCYRPPTTGGVTGAARTQPTPPPQH